MFNFMANAFYCLVAIICLGLAIIALAVIASTFIGLIRSRREREGK